MLSIFPVGKYNSVQLDIRDSIPFFPFPVQFFSFLCLLFQHFEASPNISLDRVYGAGRREIRRFVGGRIYLCSFVLYCFLVKGN